MNDTSPEMEEKTREMIMKKSPTERVLMGCAKTQAARDVIICAIKKKNPNISKTELRKEFFLKFYGSDFSPAEQEKILKSLETHPT